MGNCTKGQSSETNITHAPKKPKSKYVDSDSDLTKSSNNKSYDVDSHHSRNTSNSTHSDNTQTGTTKSGTTKSGTTTSSKHPRLGSTTLDIQSGSQQDALHITSHDHTNSYDSDDDSKSKISDCHSEQSVVLPKVVKSYADKYIQTDSSYCVVDKKLYNGLIIKNFLLTIKIKSLFKKTRELNKYYYFNIIKIISLKHKNNMLLDKYKIISSKTNKKNYYMNVLYIFLLQFRNKLLLTKLNKITSDIEKYSKKHEMISSDTKSELIFPDSQFVIPYCFALKLNNGMFTNEAPPEITLNMLTKNVSIGCKKHLLIDNVTNLEPIENSSCYILKNKDFPIKKHGCIFICDSPIDHDNEFVNIYRIPMGSLKLTSNVIIIETFDSFTLNTSTLKIMIKHSPIIMQDDAESIGYILFNNNKQFTVYYNEGRNMIWNSLSYVFVKDFTSIIQYHLS